MVTIVVVAVALILPAALNAQSPGAIFGAREPIACKSTKDPARGPLSPEQAARYVRCAREGVTHGGNGNSLYLLEKAAFEVAKGRPYQTSDSRLVDIDPAQPVYPVRGTFDLYICKDPKQQTSMQLGKNCSLNKDTKSSGVCYKTGFGDWKCEVGYDFDFRASQRNIPGPR
jgi:hypothetical protein